MRYKAMFVAGLVVGFIAGTRAGRERYDQMVRLARQAAGSPQMQKATAKTTDLAKAAAPKLVDAAKQAGQQAADRLPFTGGKDGDAEAPSGEAGSTDGRMPYQADGSPASFDGMR
jgi:phage terminase large subunit-like protein